MKRQRGVCLTDLDDALKAQGRYADARNQYEKGLEMAKGCSDRRQQGVILGQLGALAMLEGNLKEATDRCSAALTLSQQLGEPATEATGWHQLGIVFQEAREWDEAERCYREAARIREELGMISGQNSAAGAWHQLAMVSNRAGKPEAAEIWYRKVIQVCRGSNHQVGLALTLFNLADLLQNLPGRLTEARQLAEEAFAIDKKLDPGAAEIWKTYDILAGIAEKEAASVSDSRTKSELQTQAGEYRRLAREAKRNFAGTRHELRKHAPLIVGTILATEQPVARTQLEELLPRLEQVGGTNVGNPIRRILDGERNADVLCESLDFDDSMIVEAILQGLDDPSSLQDLLPDEEQDEQDST